MAKKSYVIHFKRPETSVECVRAATAEVVDVCLVLHSEVGELAGLFLLEDVEAWSAATIH